MLAISKWYPDMHSFFQKKLGVPNAPDDILVSELLELATAHAEQALSHAIHVRITHMLDELSSAVETESIPSSIHSLCEAAIFPTTSPSSSGSLTLRSLDQCYLPDKSGTYATAFKDKVPLLQLNSVPIDRITPLLSLASFKRRIRTLEAVVIRIPVIEGERTLDNEITSHYTERVEFFER